MHPAPIHATRRGFPTNAIDASRLNAVIGLDAPWRFEAGNDPHFADSA